MPLRIYLQTKDTGNSSKSFKQKSDPTCNFEKSAWRGMGQVERIELRRDRRLLCETDDDESLTYGGRNGGKWTTMWNKLYGVK